MKERLQKIISSSGIASRRAGEELIKAGKVSVNGVTASLGESADLDTDIICVDGVVLKRPAEHTYIMLNKPRGYVTTLSDEKGRHCVSELVSDVGTRVFPVGRLDMYSEGLLILTDDGDFANNMMHPSHEVKKTYYAWIEGSCSDEALKMLQSPLCIDGYRIKPALVKVLAAENDFTQLSITIHEGRNRQIRKMCMLCGLKLKRLMRVSEGSLLLGDLKVGKWRHLSKNELQELKENER